MYNDYNFATTDVSTADAGVVAAMMAFLGAYLVVVLVVAVFFIICMWRIFVKAGKPGWAALIPIYNFIVLLEVVGRPLWWVVALLAGIIPVVGPILALIVSVIVMVDLAKSFGKDTGFAVLLILLPIVGYPMLAFGKVEYKGPAAPAVKAPVAK